jgi:hypothetical protein
MMYRRKGKEGKEIRGREIPRVLIHVSCLAKWNER